MSRDAERQPTIRMGGASRPSITMRDPRREGPSEKPTIPTLRPNRTGERHAFTDDRTFSGIQAGKAPDYLVIGHICADLLEDGRTVLGGTALYSALTAARLGWRVGVLTRGLYGQVVKGIEIPSLDQYAGEMSFVVQEAEDTTVFMNRYEPGRRVQYLKHWGGEIDLRGLPPHWRNARVIHLGPIAQEIDPKQTGALTPRFLGATPQGWLRDWDNPQGIVRHKALRLPSDFVNRLDGIVVSDEEIGHCREVVERVGRRRLGVITRGENGARVIAGGVINDLPGYEAPANDLTGAGDVFAAAFFTKAVDPASSATQSGQFANAVAALSLRGVGPSGVPTREEVVAFLDSADELPIRR